MFWSAGMDVAVMAKGEVYHRTDGWRMAGRRCAPIFGSAQLLQSISPQQPHQLEAIERSTGFRSTRAHANAMGAQGSHSMAHESRQL